MTGSDHPKPEPGRKLTRRSMLAGTAVGAAAGVGGFVVGRQTSNDPSPGAPEQGVPVEARGATQAGVDRPAARQLHALFVVVDLPVRSRWEVAALLAALGGEVLTLTDPERPVDRVTPDGAGDLTVTVGVGPRLVRLAGADLPGVDPLPRFVGDADVPARLHGGDLLLAAHASDSSLLDRVSDHLLAGLDGAAVRWAQHGVRGIGPLGLSRNPLGYLDGIVVPRTPEEMAENVWIADGPARSGTICVLRRLRLDVHRFTAESPTRQDAIIGRKRSDGSPLSGGSTTDPVDLGAKTDDGSYLVPARSHARAAHPSFTGSGTMLRRSYPYVNGTSERGLLFVSFQRDLDTFVRTQHRLDDIDDLMGYTTPTASGSFLVLPGLDTHLPLGAGLFG